MKEITKIKMISLICVALFCLSMGIGNINIQKNNAKAETFTTTIQTGCISKIRFQSLCPPASKVNGSCSQMIIYPCELVCCLENPNTGKDQKYYYMEYSIETIMNAGKGWEIMGGELQAGSSTYCKDHSSNAGWSTILNMKWPACSQNAPSSTNKPSTWELNCNNLDSRALPANTESVGKGDTQTFLVGFSGGFGYMGASAGVQLTDSKTVTYGAICVNPYEKTPHCVGFETSDNIGETTSSAITTFTVYVGSAIQISPEWAHIFVIEKTHYVSTSETYVYSGVCNPVLCGVYSLTSICVGGGFNVDS